MNNAPNGPIATNSDTLNAPINKVLVGIQISRSQYVSQIMMRVTGDLYFRGYSSLQGWSSWYIVSKSVVV